MTKQKHWIISIFLICVGAISCSSSKDSNNFALLSTLFNQRMTVLLKGTYATDRPLSRAQINGNRLFVDADDNVGNLKHAADTGCIPFSDVNCLPTYANLPIFLDIGELRLSSRSPSSDLSEITSQEDAEKFWDTLSVERQVYCSTPYAADFDNACVQTGGLINFQEFVNGRGAVYPSHDVPAGVFLHSGIYVRAFATGFGIVNGQVAQSEFDNRDILGFNVISLMQYEPNLDAASIQLRAPEWFPLHHKIVLGQEQTIVLDHGEYSAVLEMRFNLIENLMAHTFFNAGLNSDVTVVTTSDWRKNHDEASADRGFNNGGNTLSRTRLYYPHITNNITISGGSESTRHYYSAYIINEEFKSDNLPLAATPVRNGSDNKLTNIMPNVYEIQCRYDCNNDGYPELVLSTTGEFTLGNGPAEVSMSRPCGCGIDAATVAANSCVAQTGCY